MNKKIILIFLAAFFIRLIALNQSLWLDEAVTANVVRNFRLSQIISGFSPNDFHPPLYYLFMKLWTNFFGYSEIALRMPSILFSLLTGWIIYKICRLRASFAEVATKAEQGFGEPLWAAVFFLFNPLIIYYSQEARMYMMVTFFLTGALYFFISKKNQILFNLFIFLSLLTFYGSIFLVAAFLLYFLYKKQYKNLFICLLVVFVYFLTISPLLYQQLVNSKIALTNVVNWSAVLGKANIKNLLLIPIKFSIGRISFYPKWLYWGIAGIWTGFVLFTIKTVLSKTVFIKTVFYLLITPLVIGFLVSFFTPMLQYFRFIYLIPLMCLILGSSQLLSWSDRIKIVINILILSGFLIFSLVYLLNPAFHREDWKSLVKSLPKDKPVYMIETSSDPVKYYNQSLKVLRFESSKNSKEKQIIVIPYTADIYGLDYKKSLTKSGYQQKEVKNFRELSFEIWRRR